MCHSQTIKTNTFMNSSCPWFATMCTKTGTTGEVVSGSQPHPAVSFCAGALKRSGRQCWSSPKRLCRQACNETFKDNLPMMVMSHDILAMEKSSWMIFLWNMRKVKMQGLSTVVEATVVEQKWPCCHAMPYPFASPLKLEHYFALGLIRLGQQWSPAALPADLVSRVRKGSGLWQLKLWDQVLATFQFQCIKLTFSTVSLFWARLVAKLPVLPPRANTGLDCHSLVHKWSTTEPCA